MNTWKPILFIVSILILSFTVGVDINLYTGHDTPDDVMITGDTTSSPDTAYLRKQLSDTEIDLENANNVIEMYEDTYGKVYVDVPVASCAEVTGKAPRLINNLTAHNATWTELIYFLYYDDYTDMKIYNEYYYACTDFAEELHNNAELHGIRAAFVYISFEDASVGHAMNAFMTTDYGLQFIDVTGSTSDTDTSNHNKRCYVEIGKNFTCNGIDGKEYDPLGIVKEIEIYW